MTVLEEAGDLVNGDKQQDYDHPRENYRRTAAIWSVILGSEVTPKQAALCMIGLKLAREAHRAKRDNLVDLAGYVKVAAIVDGLEDIGADQNP